MSPKICKSANIKDVIDLPVLQSTRRLKSILGDLKIGAGFKSLCLHCAGNDANYNLRAVLLSAALAFEAGQDADEGEKGGRCLWKEKVERTKEIAISGIPDGRRSSSLFVSACTES